LCVFDLYQTPAAGESRPAYSAYFHITILNLFNITFDAMVLMPDAA
jgi:hypothetical protein